MPHLGDTIHWKNWVISLAKVGWTRVLHSGTFGDISDARETRYGYVPDARYWLFWVDLHNVGAEEAAPELDFVWRLNQGESKPTIEDSSLYALPDGRDQLSPIVAAGASLHPLLVFNGGSDRPTSLLITQDFRGAADIAQFAIRPTDPVVQWPDYVPPPTVTPRPAAASYNAVPSGTRIGATCGDGTHSDATGRGACSHHGGVTMWLHAP